MRQHVIIEKLKEQINDRSVKAAVFYSFNFDSKFFENYLLPVFLPEVNFSDNEIQNSILWRQYAYKLPAVTVYCDFHTKYPEAPNLEYQVRAIDLPSSEKGKFCFHPKVNLVLLEDGALIVMIGSNNLTVGGWCTNKEAISIVELKNGENLPYQFKFPLLKFFEAAFRLSGEEAYSKSEALIHRFLKQVLYNESDDCTVKFYNSFSSSFASILDQLLLENDEQAFESFEIISPYLTTQSGLIESAVKYSQAGKIQVSTPYFAMNEADIPEADYKSFQEAGVIWSKYSDPGTDKAFRFDHSKVYRLKGRERMFTIVGSVNFTKAAWSGVKANGNIESAVVYSEPVDQWVPWLKPDVNPDIKFTVSDNIEKNNSQRKDAPNISFRLNWYEKTLSYRHQANTEFWGKIYLDGDRGVNLKKGKIVIPLNNENWIENLSLNPSIKVTYNGDVFYFYPEQIGLESKPLSIKLRITDRELLDLWNRIPTKSKERTEISNLIEEYVRKKTDSEGDIIEDEQNAKSTLNFMASHISALINLEQKIYLKPKLVRDYEIVREFFNYYLFTDNIDTLIGYRKMLSEMHQKKEINRGFYWFILELLMKEFYNSRKNRDFYSFLRGEKAELKLRQDRIGLEISNELKLIEKEIAKDNSMQKKDFEWLKSQIS